MGISLISPFSIPNQSRFPYIPYAFYYREHSLAILLAKIINHCKFLLTKVNTLIHCFYKKPKKNT